MCFHVHATLIYYTYIHYIYIYVCVRVCACIWKQFYANRWWPWRWDWQSHGQDTNLEVSITGGLMSSSSSSSLGSLTKTLGAAATPSDEPKVGNLEIMGNDNLSDPNQIHQIQRFWSLFFWVPLQSCAGLQYPWPHRMASSEATTMPTAPEESEAAASDAQQLEAIFSEQPAGVTSEAFGSWEGVCRVS